MSTGRNHPLLLEYILLLHVRVLQQRIFLLIAPLFELFDILIALLDIRLHFVKACFLL